MSSTAPSLLLPVLPFDVIDVSSPRLCRFDQAGEDGQGEETVTLPSLRRQLIQFERTVKKNQEMRVKFPDEPEKSVQLPRRSECNDDLSHPLHADWPVVFILAAGSSTQNPTSTRLSTRSPPSSPRTQNSSTPSSSRDQRRPSASSRNCSAMKTRTSRSMPSRCSSS